jgi:hypothetical protein
MNGPRPSAERFQFCLNPIAAFGRIFRFTVAGRTAIPTNFNLVNSKNKIRLTPFILQLFIVILCPDLHNAAFRIYFYKALRN